MDPPPYDEKPAYAASLEFYGVALAKVELDTPWNNHSGQLRPVVVELNSNQLRLYRLDAPKPVISALRALFVHQNYADKEARAPAEQPRDYMFDGDAYGDDGGADPAGGVLAKLKKHISTSKVRKRLRGPMPAALLDNGLLLEPTADAAEYARFAVQYRGSLVRCYTLSNLMVGEAPSVNSRNYKEDGASHGSEFALLNYRNVLRLRVEFSQLLLHFWSFHGMVHWYRRLCIGRDLASVLDARSVVPLKSIPRNYSARNNAFFAPHHDGARKRRASLDADFSDSETCTTSSAASTSSGATTSSAASSVCSHTSSPSHVTVYGHRIVCYEDLYSPLEKQYISNCIAVLNSFDKWVGRKVTISNFRRMLPKNDAHNVNEGDGTKVFISSHTFNALARTYAKSAPPDSSAISQCKEYFVEPQGLVSVEV